MLRAHLARHWFSYAVPLALLLAWVWPDGMRSGGVLAAGGWWQWLIIAIFFGSGLSLPGRELAAALTRWRLHLFIQGFGLLLIPLLAWAAKPLAERLVGPSLTVGCLVLACQPTTIAGCIAMTRAAGGDTAGALFNAATGSLLGVVVTPAMGLLLTGIALQTPLGEVLRQLALLVAAPLFAGQVVRLALPAVAAANLWINRATLACLLGILLHVFSDSIHTGLPPLPPGALPALLAGVIGGHLLILLLAWRASGLAVWGLERPRRITALICSTQKSAALGIPMLTVMFRDDPALGLYTLPLLLWHPTQLTVAGILAPRLRRWAAAQDQPLVHPAAPPGQRG